MMEEILDKVRAEIVALNEYYDNDYFSNNKDAMFKCEEVLQIIDNYRLELAKSKTNATHS